MFGTKIPIAAMLFFTAVLSLSANPFITPEEKNLPDPVRLPAFSAPSGLIDAQLKFRESMADFFSAWQEKRSTAAAFALAAAGFIYGILHALGPGHRKVVIFSLFIGRKAKIYEPVLAGFLSALLHGLSAAFIILAFRTLSNRLLIEKVDETALYLEGFTYLLLALLAVGLFIAELAGFFRKKKEEEGRWGLYGTIALTSLFPCPAAIMILIFSLSLDLFPLGVMAVGALSLGMGVTISLIGMLAWSGRQTLMGRIQREEKIIKRIALILEGGSYLILILFSLWMALPFLISLPGLG